ncbi:MAG: hypothetical protein A2Y12_14585 [Planctomycetes bacterium GWF2_42_9]|nr:MAG: hypothetical protein A2Y12_14585 [Planctomycetes bacterium GWF2_42_9]
MKRAFSAVIVLALLNFAAFASDCNCGDFCSACQSQTPKYIHASLSNLQGCPSDFQQGVSQVYPCFNEQSMDIVMKQDPLNACVYYYNGPSFNIANSSFEFRLSFYLNLSAQGKTEFSIIVQENCQGWYDLFWSTASNSQSCNLTGDCEFSSLCNVPFPAVESGNASWNPLVLEDGNCPGCGDSNEIPENCGDLDCQNLDDYAFIAGKPAYYNGPFIIYSPSNCDKNAKTGNALQTAKIVCPGAQLVTATAQSSAPKDIIVAPTIQNCQSSDSALFSIKALRGTGTVTLTATFYETANAEDCIAHKTTKTITIRVQPDPGDNCCSDQYNPVLLKGCPGNVSTPIRAGANPLNEWPKANIYSSGNYNDLEIIIPGRFTPVIFNNGRPPEYMRGWKANIDDSNIITVTNIENIKYIYKPANDYKIHLIKNAQDQNIVEFVYDDSNNLPIRQNDLTDANLFISYHYDTGLLKEIQEHAYQTYRQFVIEYDNNLVSFVGGGCSQCAAANGNKKYYYNSQGVLHFEKSINDEIIYEYAFDSKHRLTEKWLGNKQNNQPICIIDYTEDSNGYTADIKNYIDNSNFIAIREYYTYAHILTKRTVCELYNENIDSPIGRIFAEEFIYDLDEFTGKIQKLTVTKPKADSVRTEYIYDVNCGELISEIAYDSNNYPTIIVENNFEYIDSNGNITTQPDNIFLARIIKNKDVYDANTFYQYADGSNYPSQILFPNGQLQAFNYDSEKQIIKHQFIDSNGLKLLLKKEHNYDAFGNLTSEKHCDANDINDTAVYYYNNYNEVIRIKSPQDVITGRSYDNYGRLISEYTLADANDLELARPTVISQKTYSYDANGLLTLESVAIDTGSFEFDCPAGKVYKKYKYDKQSRLVKIIEDANGQALETTFEYDRQDELIKVVKPGGVWFEYIYDARGLMLNEITGNGENSILITSYQYDENGNCISKTDIDSATSILQYNEFDYIKNHYLPSGSYINYQYNAAGETTLETLCDINNIPLQQTVYGYDNCGRCTSIRKRQTPFINNDNNDFVAAYKFDCLDNLIKKTIKSENETNDINIQFHYDSKNRLAKFTDAMSNSQSFIYDKDDNVKSVINGMNLASVNDYDAYGRKILSQTPNNNRLAFKYDSLNRCIKETLYDVNFSPVEQKRYEYDNAGNLSRQITMRDPASVQNADITADNIIFFNYNTAGLLESQITIYDNNNQSIEYYDYDAIGRISKITDPAGNSTEILYDVNTPGRISGQLLTLTDGNSQRTIPTFLKYDSSGRIIQSSIDSNLTTQFFYDIADRVAKQISPGGLETSYKYDNLNNVTEIKQVSRTTHFSYDRTGRLVSITAYDPNAQKTIFEYNKNAKITKIIFADGTQEKFKYDPAGKLIEKTLRGNAKIYSGYDAENNLIWQSDDPNGPDGNIDSAEFLIEFEYNANGMITYAAKSIKGQIVSESQFEYNGLGKIENESTSLFGLNPISIEYEYDASGNIISQSSDWSDLNFTHDGLGRIKSISRNDCNIAQLGYFGEVLNKKILFEPQIEYNASFDQIGRINRCKSESQTGSVLDLIYSYGNNSNRSKCIYNHLTNAPFDNFESDIYGQITEAEYFTGKKEEFAYDFLGNRTLAQTKEGYTETYYHNLVNQYTKIRTNLNFFNFVYDSNIYWDQNARLSYSGDDNFSYEYDLLGNLTKVTADGQTIAEFVYDALGRRIRKTTSDCDTIYYYDLSNRITAEYNIDPQGTPVFVAEYIYGSNFADCIARFLKELTPDVNSLIKLVEFCHTYLYSTGQPEYDTNYDYDQSGIVDLQDYSVLIVENQISLLNSDSSEKHWYYLNDAIGSVAAIAGANPNTAIEYFYYDVYGRPDHVSSTGSNFLFAGMTYDEPTGKYYCVNRYYDPDLGIFLTPDPLLFADGYNFYTYAKNNPVVLTDRFGLKSSLVEEIQFLIGKGQIRAAAEKLTQEIKKSCDKINTDCKTRKCVAGVVNPNCGKAEKCYQLYRKALEYDKQINSECAKAAAIGSLAGSAQGLLNTVNGVQDGAVSTANLALGIWNSSGALICDKELDYIISPDWSKDVIVRESDIAHDVSKFLGGQGAITLATAGTGSGQAVKHAQQGIYEFTAASGKTYVGQSANIPQRLMQHINNGKLLAKDVQTVKTTPITGGKIAREIAEQARIDRLGGIKNLENVRNPIGPARSYLFKK